AKDCGTQDNRADEKAETAERLKSRQVGVLDGVKRGQPLRSGRGVRSEVAGTALDRLRGVHGAIEGNIDEQKTISLLLRKQLYETSLSHQQFALEDAVGQRSDEPQPQRPIAADDCQ